MQNFSGMLFTLKKREQGIRMDDSDYYKFMILGFYDGLDIHTVDKWYELRPKGLLERKLQVDLNTPFIDQYTIRALMPSNRAELDARGFAYDFWERVGRKSAKNHKQYGKAIRRQYPFICMSVVNLTESYVKRQGNLPEMQNTLVDILEECVDGAGYVLSDLHCAIYPSIGYSDFIILFLTDDLSKAANIINRVRASVVATDTDEGIAVVSNCYSVCGLDKDYFSQPVHAIEDKMQITIRINLREGLSARDFLAKLKDEIEKAQPDANGMIQKLEESYYVSFGNSDCLILPDKPLDEYLKWHGPNGILNPGSDFFRLYVAGVRTSVRILGLDCDESDFDYLPRDSDLKIYEDAFDCFIEKYDKFVSRNNMHIRGSRAIRQTMKNFLNIARASHGFDVKYIVGAAFLSQLRAVEDYIAIRQKRTKGLTDEKRERAEQYNTRVREQQSRAVVSLEDFKNSVGALLSDLIRSDRPFIEGNALTHSGIGSATKLLFAYSAMLNNFSRKFGEQDNFSFIVSSGGCDKTEAIDGLDFVHGDKSIKKPIIIMIPEMSLYDIQGTLFRLLHEYMHFIGNRRRRLRYRCLVSAIANYIAWEMCEMNFGPERLQELSDKACGHLSNVQKRESQKNVLSIFEDEKKKARSAVADIIRTNKLFTTHEQEAKEEELYSDWLEKTVLSLDSMIDIFSVKEDSFEEVPEECIQKQIYRILYHAGKQIASRIRDMLVIAHESERSTKNFLLPEEKYTFLVHHYDIMDGDKNRYDRKLWNFIDQYFNSLVGNYSMSTGAVERFHARYTYTDLLDGVMFAMVESFSDSCAVKAVDMPLEDFLLSFIYEEWEIQKVFPKTFGNVLRLGADLKVLYHITDKLKNEEKNRVIAKVKLVGNQGYTYQNVLQMLNRVDDALRMYQFCWLEGIRNEVEIYLKDCIANPDEWYSAELGELYNTSDMSTAENTYMAIDKVICLWKNIGGNGAK